MIYYKVRSKSTSKYYMGGVNGRWNKSGKVWDTIGKLRAMITLNMSHKNYADFSDWEIIEYEVTEKSIKNVHEIITHDRLKQLILK